MCSVNVMGVFPWLGLFEGRSGDATVVVELGDHWADPTLCDGADWSVVAERRLSLWLYFRGCLRNRAWRSVCHKEWASKSDLRSKRVSLASEILSDSDRESLHIDTYISE